MMFADDDLTLRDMTTEEAAVVLNDPRVKVMRWAHGELMKSRKQQ